MKLSIRTAKTSPPIGEQLLAKGILTATAKQVWEWEEDRLAMWRLYDRGLINATALRRMRDTLARRIEIDLKLNEVK